MVTGYHSSRASHPLSITHGSVPHGHGHGRGNHGGHGRGRGHGASPSPSPPAASTPSEDYDYDCDDLFDWERYQRDQGDGMTRSSEVSPTPTHSAHATHTTHTPGLASDSAMTPPSHYPGASGILASGGHLNSLSHAMDLDDEWDYSTSQQGFSSSSSSFFSMLNSDSTSSPSSSSGASFDFSSPSYSAGSPTSASSPSSYLPSSPASSSSSSSSSSRKGKSHSSASSSQGSSSSSKSRKRHLQHPEQTAEVRENGACIRCRVRRVRCDTSLCKKCEKFDYLCIHKQLREIGPVFNMINDTTGGAVQREDLTGQLVNASITFSDADYSAPRMKLCIAGYVDKNGARDGSNCAIPREKIPTWGDLAAWAGAQIQHEDGEPFMKAIEAFMTAYTYTPDPKYPPKLPKVGLVDKVWKLSCMFKIWMTPYADHSGGLYYHTPRGGVKRLPHLVHEELRHIAKKAMESLERDILRELDGCMTQSKAVKPIEKPLLWVSVWQLIFLYRKLLGSNVMWNASPRFHQTTGVLLNALVAYYTGFFNTPKSLQLDLDLSGSSVNSAIKHHLCSLFRDIISHRLDFYYALRESDNVLDIPIVDAIIGNELKRLSARRGRKQPGALRNVVDEDEDEDMEG